VPGQVPVRRARAVAGVTSEIAARPRSTRALALACLGLAGAAGLVWGSSALRWYTVSPVGRAPLTFTGAEVAPSLTGFAWVALAGVAGLVATGGVVRRVVAGLLAVAGAAVALIGRQGQTRISYAVESAGSLPPGMTVPPPPLAVTAAPLLAVAGGLVLLAVGVLVLLCEPRLPRLGARYAAAGARPVEAEPDRAAWQDLDAGRDPTADPAGDEGDDPDDGAGRGRG
jgi:Tryptophan-associated transmembrane protein (Trp_oprn_chp)